MGLKIIFAGTPAFAMVAFEKLIQSSHQIIAVYTQPDRPSGRGLKLTPSPIKKLALQYKLALHQPATLKDSYEQDLIAKYNADAIVVAAYGLLLPSQVLHGVRLGCINIHPSLLPRWRGAAPIQRTIYAGDTVTGVSIMQMDEGLDTGPVLYTKEYKLTGEETSAFLQDHLATLGASALIETLDQLEQSKVIATPQDDTKATYAAKISKEEALIDWQAKAIEIDRIIRAFNPWPVACTSWQGKNLRIWSAKKINQSTQSSPRTIVNADKEGIDIATGEGVLRILQVQLPGGKIVDVSDFYNAHRDQLIVGQHLL